MHLWDNSTKNNRIFIITIYILFNILSLVKLVIFFQILMLNKYFTFFRLPVLSFELGAYFS